MKQSVLLRLGLTAVLAVALLLITTNLIPSAHATAISGHLPTAEWVQTAKLIASNGQAGDWFGRAVVVSPELIVVGAPDSDYAQPTAGAVYVFERSPETGQITQVAILTASDAATSDEFGFSIAMSGDIIVVGAFRDDVVATDSGSAYVFQNQRGAGERVAPHAIKQPS